MSCRLCLCDPSLKNDWGCDTPTQSAVWVDDEGNEYFNCPLVFIPLNVQVWFEEYSYQKEFGGAPPYRKQSKKFIEAMRIYDTALITYRDLAPKPKASQDLSALISKRNKDDAKN